MTALLDVNVLVALAFPNHIHHARAHAWFAARERGAWATCPTTQTGFVRVSSNPKIIPEAPSPADALALLRLIVALDGHVFWADTASPADDAHGAFQRVVGYRQVSDAHLVALAVERHGRVATFDRGFGALVPAGLQPDDVVLLIS